MIDGCGNGRHSQVAQHLDAGRMQPFPGKPFVVRLGLHQQDAGTFTGKGQGRDAAHRPGSDHHDIGPVACDLCEVSHSFFRFFMTIPGSGPIRASPVPSWP